jgi:hypothetical protein
MGGKFAQEGIRPKAGSKGLIAVLLLTAVGAPFVFFHYGFAPYHCVNDYCTVDRAIWGRDTKIILKPEILLNSRTGKPILENGKPISGQPVREGIMGVVIRDDIPTSVGIVGGLLAPVALLLAALILGVKMKRWHHNLPTSR